LVESISSGRTFNVEYYRDNIFAALIPFHSESDGREFVLHADNIMTHTTGKCRDFRAKNGMRIAIHPPDSHDIAPLHFFLFGYVKHCLEGIVFSSHGELLPAIQQVWTDIPIKNLYAVFEHWMERLELVCQNTGYYYQ
jgi:hypothetical protein